MCAEAVPWRCHRSLVADALIVRGIRVEDIMGKTRSQFTLSPLLDVCEAIASRTLLARPVDSRCHAVAFLGRKAELPLKVEYDGVFLNRCRWICRRPAIPR